MNCHLQVKYNCFRSKIKITSEKHNTQITTYSTTAQNMVHIRYFGLYINYSNIEQGISQRAI